MRGQGGLAEWHAPNPITNSPKGHTRTGVELILSAPNSVLTLQGSQVHQHVCVPGIPGGTVDNNLPVSAGDTGLIPGPGRFHMLQSNKTLCTTATGPAL